ncbi:MAG: hypothetical protein PHV35_09620, partial [Mariniphaga sp.]|nr:hypothetical protein [Mariniphaga sp.]
MKAIFRLALLIASLTLTVGYPLLAQRVVTGTVYREGKPAAGVTVEAHRGGSMMTSFDGKYEVEADVKTKWLRFTFLDESSRLDISDKPGDSFDFAFDGILPGNDDETESADVILKTAEELIRDQDRDFMNELSLYNEFY